jgi:hypothetical protein
MVSKEKSVKKPHLISEVVFVKSVPAEAEKVTHGLGRAEKDDRCSLKKSILLSEKSPPVRRRARESAEN